MTEIETNQDRPIDDVEKRQLADMVRYFAGSHAVGDQIVEFVPESGVGYRVLVTDPPEALMGERTMTKTRIYEVSGRTPAGSSYSEEIAVRESDDDLPRPVPTMYQQKLTELILAHDPLSVEWTAAFNRLITDERELQAANPFPEQATITKERFDDVMRLVDRLARL